MTLRDDHHATRERNRDEQYPTIGQEAQERLVVSQFGNLDHFSCGFASTAKSGCGMLCAKHMPKGPKGQKRPADVIGNAVTIMKIATGEIDESGETDDGKSKAAVELGRKGGRARASKLTPQQRREIAKKAAAKRWAKD